MPDCLLKGAVLGALLGIGAVNPAAAESGPCAARYFTADERPLARPGQELAATLVRAKAGVAREQRNLAISYETGYLVARCADKAAYWYRKAAQGGDDIAQKWLARQQQFAEIRGNGECFEEQCRQTGNGGARSASFVAGPQGHYFAPVTINGVAETGLIDTGASTLAMSAETARRFGIDTASGTKGKAQTASGVVDTTNLTLPVVTVGGITLHNVRVSVGIQGQMLIGMSFLGRLDMKLGAGVLVLNK